MPIWKEQNPPKKEPAMTPPDLPRSEFAVSPETPRRGSTEREGREAVITAELTIEGKIEGAGHIRIAGRFKGDVNVQGNLTIEAGAKVIGAVRAATVTIGGELEGNIEAASRVELLETGVLNGDLKAGSLTVAAGSRMRGQAEFGWEERTVLKSAPVPKLESALAT
jgi:cytoskeletal protein CcmA (bactofilin family)